jgi:type IV pilus assembly protein PilY1
MIRPFSQRKIALFLALLYAGMSPLSQAALTDLASQPLANVSGTAAVKPNIMFLLDDSGSMMQQYTPDYVSERWGAPAAGDMHCYNSGDSDGNASRDLCIVGDPPYMSSDFNSQYYNPNISYAPPVTWDGVSYTSQTSANTAGWTAVKTDGFNVQNLNQLEVSTTTANIAAQYPDRAWCDTQARLATDTVNCRTNVSGYSYPQIGSYYYGTDGTINLGSSGGTASTLAHVKYRGGAPYYYTIAAGEYCTDENLTNCTGVAIGGTPPDGYTFPAKVRWCNSAALTSCQAKKVSPFNFVKYSTTAAPAIAYGTIKIGDSGSDNPVTITDVQVNGVSIISSTVTAATGTNSSAERTTAANNLAAAIRAKVDDAYYACGGTSYSCAAYGLTAASDTVVVIPTTAVGGTIAITDASQAGFAIAVTAPANNVSRSYGVITVGNSGGGSGNVSSITVNGVEVLNGGLSNFGSNSTTNRNAAATAISNRINAYLNTTPWEYSAQTNVSGTNCNATNKVCIQAPLANGSAPNGLIVNFTTSGGVSLSKIDMANGVSRFIPTTITNINAGNTSTSTFNRVDIVPTTTTYPKAGTRKDCASTPGVCTYDEEMTNFANWYAYYRTRMQMMKSSAGEAFLSLNTSYRLGFNTINNTNLTGTSNSKYLSIQDLTNTQKQNWYTKFYAQSPSGSTPLRAALDRIGMLYEGTLAGANDPVQYSCQQNFTILTTDGYWNGSGPTLDADNVDSDAQFCTRANGCYDGGLAANTLADVAAYYYKRDLRATMDNNVPTSSKDLNSAQHMTTFTLGLGVDGLMTYRADYETATAGDFYRIRLGATGCAWTAGTCNWPVPVADSQTAVDDLWHAAVNGHGTYFSARDPAALSAGLASALNNLKVRNAAASASATSTPNVTHEDNDIFSATFRTVKWDGEIVAQKIDTATGNILPANTWEAQALLFSMLRDAAATRAIYTLNDTSPLALKDFAWTNLTSAEQAYFTNKCVGGSVLSQCATLDAAQKILANDGQKMLNFIRGQQELEVAGIYRNREHVLGDIASAKPAYVRTPRRNYGDTGYSTFKANLATREAMVYVAANDGMLHALNATTGEETWAYIPRMLMPNLYKLADGNYANNHEFYADGSAESGDVYINGQWRTILVGGLNKGGRGYYALDITAPNSPIALWEVCSDAALCALADSDIGYTFGNPVITKRPSDGKWVVLVTSGYNNTGASGDGKGYLYVLDAATGTILNKIGTGVGSTATPSGLAKITARAENASTDNTATAVFGGDLLGNLWRFDMATNSVVQLATLTDFTGAAQPITSRPDVGKCDATPMVFIGTGEYLGLSDLTTTQRQSIYGIKDATTTLGTVRTNNMVQQSLTPISGGYTITNAAVDLTSSNGWFVDLDQNSGERVNLDPQLVLGTLVITSNQPTNISSCSTGGISYMYQLNYCTGSYLASASNHMAGQQIGTSIAVGFIVIRLPSGALKTITTFAGSEKATGGVYGNVQGTARRVSWREYTQ